MCANVTSKLFAYARKCMTRANEIFEKMSANVIAPFLAFQTGGCLLLHESRAESSCMSMTDITVMCTQNIFFIEKYTAANS